MKEKLREILQNLNGDYVCPYCYKVQNNIEKTKDQYEKSCSNCDKVYIVIRKWQIQRTTFTKGQDGKLHDYSLKYNT